MNTHVNGQVWIDKNSPYKLKYRVHDTDFIVETSATYTINDDIELKDDVYLHSGEVVALDDNGKVIRASFPVDLKKVLGVVLTDVTEDNKASGVSVLQTGYLELKHPNAPFVSDLPGIIDVGSPVYWDINTAGKLSLDSPSPSSDVQYSNLPQIGTVSAKYPGEDSDSLYLHINVPSFESTMEWYYKTEEKDKGTVNITIPHNLFVGGVDTQCHVDVVFEETSNGITTEYPVLAYVSHNRSKGETIVTVSTPYTGTYKITGRVSY